MPPKFSEIMIIWKKMSSVLTEWKGQIKKYIRHWIMQDGQSPQRSMQNDRRPKYIFWVKPWSVKTFNHTTLIHVELNFVWKLCKYLGEHSELNALNELFMCEGQMAIFWTGSCQPNPSHTTYVALFKTLNDFCWSKSFQVRPSILRG